MTCTLEATGGELTAEQTLKCFVGAVITPAGERKLFAVGVPGDREVDLGRVEVNIGALMGIGGEIEVEAASEEDLKKFPQLVKGYIGPGLTLDQPMLGENTEERQTATGIPFFVDPRVVRGTSWVTGANETRQTRGKSRLRAGL